MLETAGARLGVALAFDRFTLAQPTTPGDGHPAVGALALPDFYLALSHSEVTLAPMIGAMLADVVQGGARDPLIAACAPGRLIQSA